MLRTSPILDRVERNVVPLKLYKWIILAIHFSIIYLLHFHCVPHQLLKSVRVHFAYGRIAITLELLGRFGRFLDEDLSAHFS